MTTPYVIGIEDALAIAEAALALDAWEVFDDPACVPCNQCLPEDPTARQRYMDARRALGIALSDMRGHNP